MTVIKIHFFKKSTFDVVINEYIKFAVNRLQFLKINDDHHQISRFFLNMKNHRARDSIKTKSTPRGKVFNAHRHISLPLPCKTECHTRKHLAATKRRRAIVAEVSKHFGSRRTRRGVLGLAVK